MSRAAGVGSHRNGARRRGAAGEAAARRLAGAAVPLADDVVSPLIVAQTPGGGRRRVAPARRLLAVAAVALAALFLVSFARLPVAPRTPATIGRVLASGAHAGECDACHTSHAGGQPIAYEHALVGPDDNTLCDGCHTVPWAGGTYGGTMLYAGSAHGSSTTAIWPGPSPPARSEADAARKCLNCHDPHGWEDGSGVIPRLVNAREESLCLTCHDGSPAVTDVRAELSKPFAHPVSFADRHSGPAEALPSEFGILPLNRRHAECEDCHNPHLARRDPALPEPAPAASKRLLGTSRVAVTNGPAGSVPAYTFIAGADTLSPPVAEYQTCFKCHSSWTSQPRGQTDLGRALNPENPSYHPVEAAGRNPMIDPAAFTPGWSAASLIRCGDCHGSDLPSRRGPHGSIYRYILKRPATASSVPRRMTSDELCFACHAWDVYANKDAPESVLRASRFNPPAAVKGHAAHVGDKDVTCYACHVTHGSTSQPHLIATGRNPGIMSYTRSFAGGTCSPTCHAAQSYTVSYVR